MDTSITKQNFTWKEADYTQISNYTDNERDVINFLNILSGPSLNSSHVTTFFSFHDCTTVNSFFSGGVFYVPGLNYNPSFNTLSNQWKLYDSGQQFSVSVYSTLANFLNTNLTLEQAFYSKIEISQSCCSTNMCYYDMYSATLARGYIWYPALASSAQEKNEQDLAISNDDGSAASWHVRYFSSSSSDGVAISFAQILNALPSTNVFCSQLAIDSYASTGSRYCSSGEGYGAALIPSNLNAIPSGASLSGNWLVEDFIGIPANAFHSLQNFIGNLTDDQLCYSRMTLSMGGALDAPNLNASIVSLWYQDLA